MTSAWRPTRQAQDYGKKFLVQAGLPGGLGAVPEPPEANFLILQTSTETLDEHVVHPATLPIHADPDVMLLERRYCRGGGRPESLRCCPHRTVRIRPSSRCADPD